MTDSDIRAVAALDDELRRGMYTFIRAARRPVTRDEAAASVGISRKLAAFHLDKLVAAGLLQAGYQPAGRVGRAPKLYQPTTTDIRVAIPHRQHDTLAAILLDAVVNKEAHTAALTSAHRRGEDLGTRERASITPRPATQETPEPADSGAGKPGQVGAGTGRTGAGDVSAQAERAAQTRPLEAGEDAAAGEEVQSVGDRAAVGAVDSVPTGSDASGGPSRMPGAPETASSGAGAAGDGAGAEMKSVEEARSAGGRVDAKSVDPLVSEPADPSRTPGAPTAVEAVGSGLVADDVGAEAPGQAQSVGGGAGEVGSVVSRSEGVGGSSRMAGVSEVVDSEAGSGVGEDVRAVGCRAGQGGGGGEDADDGQVGGADRGRRRLGRLGAERALTLAEGVLAREGFEPTRESPTRLRLRNCPFHPLAGQAPELVCGLNQAFLAGFLCGLGASTVEAALEPAVGECCVVLRSARPGR